MGRQRRPLHELTASEANRRQRKTESQKSRRTAGMAATEAQAMAASEATRRQREALRKRSSRAVETAASEENRLRIESQAVAASEATRRQRKADHQRASRAVDMAGYEVKRELIESQAVAASEANRQQRKTDLQRSRRTAETAASEANRLRIESEQRAAVLRMRLELEARRKRAGRDRERQRQQQEQAAANEELVHRSRTEAPVNRQLSAVSPDSPPNDNGGDPSNETGGGGGPPQAAIHLQPVVVVDRPTCNCWPVFGAGVVVPPAPAPSDCRGASSSVFLDVGRFVIFRLGVGCWMERRDGCRSTTEVGCGVANRAPGDMLVAILVWIGRTTRTFRQRAVTILN